MERIPVKVLSDVLTSKIAGRRVKTAVFTTFTFEPGFFEPEILPLLFDQAFHQAQLIRMLELAEALRKVHNIAVYYDRSGLVAESSAKLDYRRIPLARNTGVVHPKLVLLLLEDRGELEESDQESYEVLLVGAMSANLTRAGWWENVECAWFEEYLDGDRCSIREDLFSLFSSLRRDDRTQANHEALDAIHEFLQYHTEPEENRSANGILHPRMFVGAETLSDFIAEKLAGRLDSNSYNLEIISPYFDQHDEAVSLHTLVNALQPRETRVFLPIGDDGAFLVRQGLFETVKSMPNVRWSRLEQSLLSRGKSEDGARQSRTVHAKVYRLWNRAEGRQFVIAGSVNLTQSAHSRSHAGNLEASVLIDQGMQSDLKFWLEPIDDNECPEEFRSQDETLGIDVPPISLRYEWLSKRAEYFWDSTIKEVPSVLSISSSGVHLFDVAGLVADVWTHLGDERSEQIRAILQSTSIVTVAVDGSPGASILIQEEKMEHKPSIIQRFSVEEILRYWSLLSVEQKQAFLESKFASQLKDQGIQVTPLADDNRDSMFSRFAGVFHAFARLEERVISALHDGRHREAEAYLFGAGYLSLPTVIARVLENVEDDLVNRYVTLLSAKQLLSRLAMLPDCKSFFESNRALLQKQEKDLEQIQTLKESFSFGDKGETEKFLGWFEEWFLKEMSPLESE